MKKNKDFDLFENFVDSDGDFDKVKRNIVTDEPSRAQSLNKRKLALVTTFASVLVVAIILSVIFIPFGFKPDQTANNSGDSGVVVKGIIVHGGGWFSDHAEYAVGGDFYYRGHVYENGVCIYCGKPEDIDELGFGYEPSDYEFLGNDEFLVKSYRVTKAPEDLDVVNIPSSYNGVPVTRIDENVFYGHKMNTVTIPNTITKIFESAFESCKNLTSVVIPDSVTLLYYSAFKDCTALRSVVLGKGISTIHAGAFYGCESLKKINIPETVTAVGDSAFYNCACIEKDKNLYYVGKWLVGSDAENLTDVEIREGTIGIAVQAFKDCVNITEATIPDSVKYLNKYIFAGCTALKKAAFGKNAEELGEEAFQRCEALEEITICDNLKSIGVYAFYNCKNLLKVNYNGEPYRITQIKYANKYSNPFFNNAKLYSNKYSDDGGFKLLTKLVIPATVTELKAEIFWKFNDLEAVYYEGTVNDWCKIDFGRGSNNDFNPYLFTNPLYCASEFYTKENGKYKLADDIVIDGELDEISGNAFDFYRRLRTVTVTAPVKKIGEYAFAHCDSLTSVTFPESVEVIGGGAFKESVIISSISPLNRVKIVGREAFSGCRNLKGDINLDCAEELGYEAFCNCKNIINVTLGEKITIINGGVFFNCLKMKTITFLGDITSIRGDSFAGCESLTEIIIPETVSGIELRAFAGCKSFTTIVIPDNVGTIAEFAFGSCLVLKNIVIGSGVTEIGKHCFYMDKKLESIYYHGTEEEWNAIKINETNDVLFNTPVYFYSETEPTGEGNFWHYVDGEAKAW